MIGGLYAAVLVSRDAAGRWDERAFRRTLEFLLERKVSRVVLNGVTGEYCLTTLEEFRRMLAVCREVLGASGEYLAGIGSASVYETLGLAGAAQEFGAAGLLLPMPYFFPYEQGDLTAYCESVALQVTLPTLLYQIPKFTTSLSVPTVVGLVESQPVLVGVKDSSGTLDILQALTSRAAGAIRIVGDDAVMVAAVEQEVCDGVISGVAGVMPELSTYLWNGRNSRAREEYRAAAAGLADLVAHLSPWPAPWGLKWIGEFRGIAPATFSQPVSGERRRQATELREWFEGWWPALCDRVPGLDRTTATP